MTETDLAYLAGFVDGEGTITIMRFRRTNRKHQIDYRPLLSISNTNREALEWVVSVTGVGSVQQSHRIRVGYKTNWKYTVVNSNAIVLAKILLPYLKIKKLNAEILVRYADTLITNYKPYRVSEVVLTQREELTNLVNHLNLRGNHLKEVCSYESYDQQPIC